MTDYSEQNSDYIAKFEQFPLTMAHPNFVPSKSEPVPGTERRGPNGFLISQDYRGTPERYPPVTVHDHDQQEYYEAQGYRVVGKADPAAYARAHASPAEASYVPMDYPKWVNGVLCNDAMEADKASAIEEEDEEAVESAPSILDELAELRSANARLQAQLELRTQEMQHQALAPKNKGGRPRKAPQPTA